VRYLKAVGLKKAFRKRTVVKGVDLEVHKGEIVGLLGPNGAGKTTTFYMIAGLVRVNEGQIFLDEQEITSFPLAKRARLGLTYLPQERSIFRELTVEKNILAVLEVAGFNKEERKTRKDLLLEEFHLVDLASSKAQTLSGGEARRLEIARAVAIEPSFILLDEPFAGIDPVTVAQIQTYLQYLRRKGMGIFISDHNVRETLKICDRAYIMHQGQILESGSPQKIARSPQVRDIYLGRDFKL